MNNDYGYIEVNKDGYISIDIIVSYIKSYHRSASK